MLTQGKQKIQKRNRLAIAFLSWNNKQTAKKILSVCIDRIGWGNWASDITYTCTSVTLHKVLRKKENFLFKSGAVIRQTDAGLRENKGCKMTSCQCTTGTLLPFTLSVCSSSDWHWGTVSHVPSAINNGGHFNIESETKDTRQRGSTLAKCIKIAIVTRVCQVSSVTPWCLTT